MSPESDPDVDLSLVGYLEGLLSPLVPEGFPGWYLPLPLAS